MIRRLLFLALAALTLSACLPISGPSLPPVVGPTVTTDPNASPTPTPFGPQPDTAVPSLIPSATPTLPPTATIPPTETFTPVPPPIPVRTHYTLDVLLDYEHHTARVDEVVAYQNASPDVLGSIVLVVEPNHEDQNVAMDGVAVNDLPPLNYKFDADRLEIPLDTPLPPGGTVKLSLHYNLRLPAVNDHHVFGYNSVQANLVDWYPFIPPYISGQSWLMEAPGKVGEHLVYDPADFDVTLTLYDPKLPLVVAASAPAETTGGIRHYHLENARTFALSTSTSYLSASTTVGGVTITSYHFGGEDGQARAMLQEVAKAVVTFSNRFGVYPYPSLSIVESPYYDGLEYDGLFFLSNSFYRADDGTVLNTMIDIAVHETAHQWWFGAVGNDQAREPWLDEALSTYSEWIYYQDNYPKVNGWWNFRVTNFKPKGDVDSAIYDFADQRSYANAVYLRGALFLDDLRKRIGDEAFFAFLKDYAARMAGRRATADDFFRILRQHTTADFSDLQRTYFQVQH